MFLLVRVSQCSYWSSILSIGSFKLFAYTVPLPLAPTEYNLVNLKEELHNLTMSRKSLELVSVVVYCIKNYPDPDSPALCKKEYTNDVNIFYLY